MARVRSECTVKLVNINYILDKYQNKSSAIKVDLMPLYHDKVLSINGTPVTFNTAETKMHMVIKVSSKWNGHGFSHTVQVLPRAADPAVVRHRLPVLQKVLPPLWNRSKGRKSETMQNSPLGTAFFQHFSSHSPPPS